MSARPAAILCIEDEPEIRRFLRAALTTQGLEFVGAATGKEGLAAAAAQAPDVVILDLGLPDLDGLEVTQRLRSFSDVPVIVLSARGQERDKVAALDAGADDYLTKPFGVAELLARIRVALRHRPRDASPAAACVLRVGALALDPARHRVTAGEREVRLTPIEFKLLAELMRAAGKVLTHHYLLRRVWGEAFVAQSHYLRVYMAQLRRKLELDPARPRYLLTEPGVGYRMADEG
ncbi:MAG: response regulator [Planctomycetota bacterium]